VSTKRAEHGDSIHAGGERSGTPTGQFKNDEPAERAMIEKDVDVLASMVVLLFVLIIIV